MSQPWRWPGWPASSPLPPWLHLPLAPGAAAAPGAAPAAPVLSCTRLGWPGCHGKPSTALARSGRRTKPTIRIPPTHSCPRDGNLHFTAEALRPGMHKPPALGSQPEVMGWGSPLYRLSWELSGNVSAPGCTCMPPSCIKVCIFLPCRTLTCNCPTYRGSAGPPRGVMGSLYGPLLHPLPQFPKG